ncbi:MAG: diphthamide biosynthesis enzyme Dph2 [Candidatus Micrarchaeota archaeon]
MKMLLQFPEGLKQKAFGEADRLRKEGHQVYLSASPCYGACDVALDEARALKADKIIHYGHSEYLKEKPGIPVEYVEWKVDIPLQNLPALLPHLRGISKLALATTVQHVHQLPEISKFLEKNGIRVLIGKGCFAKYEGQVLGCDPLAALSVAKEADCILFVGTGKFHPTSILPAKPVYSFDPFSKSFADLGPEIEKTRKRKKGALAGALGSKTFGILISTKPGQFCPGVAEWAKKELEERGRKAYILVSGELNPLSLENFRKIECYINTACPRLSEDTEMFGKPILNAVDLKELFELLGG